MSARRLAAVICANGLGHFRRSLEVLKALGRLEPALRIDVVCAQWQRKRMQDWDVAKDLEGDSRVSWIHDLLEPGVTWSLDPAAYADGRLLSWVARLEASGVLEGADLVLSDNLPGVLALRKDAVLMGSFLWSDVLAEAYPDDAHVARFVASERRLLAECRPPMLCVAAMAMPGVLDRTRAIPLPWMRAGAGRPDIRRPHPSGPRPKVAFLIGATGTSDPLAVAAAAALLDRGAEVALPRGLHEALRHRPGVSLFGFEAEDFLGCDLALCRPGLGAVHDCIFYGLPMVLVHEEGNVELHHNGLRIEALRLCINLGHQLAPGEVAERLLAFAASEAPGGIRERMAETPLDGIDRAAAWLRGRLGAP